MVTGKRNKSIIFFDIDGTILGDDGIISMSTRKAILKAKDNGHSICIATGRSKGGLDSEVLDISWDGYVLGSGGYVEYNNKLLIHDSMNKKIVDKFIDYTSSMTEMVLILENNLANYITPSGAKIAYNILKNHEYFKDMSYKNFCDYHEVVPDLRQVQEINKIMYFEATKYIESIIDKFGDIFDFLPNSVIQGNDLNDGEIMKKGISKAWGIKRIIEYSGFEREDVIAFGDGHNDIEMIEYAGIGIAMGNAVEVLKEKADIIAETHQNDGVSKTMSMLNLI